MQKKTCCSFKEYTRLLLVLQLRDPLTPGRPMECQITPNDWVRDLQIDKKHRQLVVLCDEGVCIIDYQTNKQVFFIRNWHETALTR